MAHGSQMLIYLLSPSLVARFRQVSEYRLYINNVLI